LGNTQFDGSVRKAASSQSALKRDREHCSLDPERLAAIGLPVGSQIRVRRSAKDVALYTVSETHEESSDTTLRMGLAARERLETEEEFPAVVSTEVPNPTLSDDDAEKGSEFVERLVDDGCQRGLVCVAPHGGAIERHTDSQAELVASRLGPDRASVWLCRGFKEGGGALKAWHVRSSDLCESSFPLLRSIITRGFAHAVAFHGFTDSGILIGGAAPRPLKKEIAAALRRALAGAGIHVRLATRSDNFDGDSPHNIVNRLTLGGMNGVQIEQSLEAREKHAATIAEVVAAVYSEKLNPVVHISG
jgi:phage replication-related protein YjqB (UPF0714/DUF867 family)